MRAGSRGQPKQVAAEIRRWRRGLAASFGMAALLVLTSSALASPTAIDQSPPSSSLRVEPGVAGEEETINDRELMPASEQLFKPNQVEPDELEAQDCHMRNLDLCYAGLLSSSAKPMPTTDPELEARCDEFRLAASCLAIFNKRCHTFKVFSLLAPASQLERATRLKQPAGFKGAPMPRLEQVAAGNLTMEQSFNTLADLQTLCDPASAKQLPGATKSIRQGFFRIARCLNERAANVRPCVEDLKTAVQLFYEPQRKLPLNATCCAALRFRECSTRAVDNLCGLGSYQQLEKMLASASGASTQLLTRTMDRMCGKALAGPQQATYCAEVLPPSGMLIAERRGRKASKLAKVLGLFSMGSAGPADPFSQQS